MAASDKVHRPTMIIGIVCGTLAAFAWAAVANEGGLDVARWPNVQAWAERLMKLPGAAHPYDAMPKEDRVAA